MRSIRNNANNLQRPGEDGKANTFQEHTSSEDEDELTQLKPNIQQSQKPLKQQNKSSKKSNSNKHKHYKNGIFQDPNGHGLDMNSHNYILNGGQQYEDTLSPNGSDNMYAEASLLPSSMTNPLSQKEHRYEQGK